MPRIRTYGLDIDTIRYAQRVKSGSGTTILPEPLKQLNDFVVGMKRIGLWNSMVCWPMRSFHNAGTGSTVYSLGGLGVYNGSILNSAPWSVNGIVCDGTTGHGVRNTSMFDMRTSSYMTCYNVPRNNPARVIHYCGTFTYFGNNGSFVGVNCSNTLDLIQMSGNTTGWSPTAPSPASVSFTPNNVTTFPPNVVNVPNGLWTFPQLPFHCLNISHQVNTVTPQTIVNVGTQGYFNQAYNQNIYPINAWTTFLLNGRSNTNIEITHGGTYAFSIIFNRYFTELRDVYRIARQSLGTGILLPPAP